MVDRVDHPAVAAIWDVVHPWRHGERPEQTAVALAGRLALVQVKDAVRRPDAVDADPVLPGTGDVPIHLVLSQLDALGYDGWLSLEYERAWHPQLPPLEDALEVLATWLAGSRPS